MKRVPGSSWWPAVLMVVSVLWAKAGTIETTDRRRWEGTVTLTAQGRLEVLSEGGMRQNFSLDEIRTARFQSPGFEPEALPRGWSAEDIGDIRGSSSEEGEQRLTLQVFGKAVAETKAQTVHYTYRVVRGDGGIVGKVETGRLKGASLAGVMLRENLDPAGGYVLLGITAKNELRLQWRERKGSKLTEVELGRATLPIWLRLARNHDKGKVVLGWRSQNGIHWERVGQAKLHTAVEAWPPGGAHTKPLLHAGVAITGPGSEKVSTAHFGSYVVHAKGLLGEYYADDLFKELKATRLETKLEMTWHRSPAPEIPPERFSARWTGQLEAKYSEPYRIYLDASEDTRIWLDGQEIPRVARNTKAKQPKEIPLMAGRKYDLRIDFRKGEKPSLLRLGWSSKSQNYEIIPAQQLSYTFTGASPSEQHETNFFLPKGIWLRNGSFLAGEVVSSDGSSCEVTFGRSGNLNIFNQKIAYVLFRTSRRALPVEAVENKTGLLLANGDFLESEFTGLKERTLRLSSVLFGLRTFSLDKPEPLALLLHQCVPDMASSEVVLLDGSVLKARSVRSAGTQWLVEDSALGQVRVPQEDVAEIRNLRATAAASRNEK